MVHYCEGNIYGEVDCIQAMIEKAGFSETDIHILLKDMIIWGRMEMLNQRKLWRHPKWFVCN